MKTLHIDKTFFLVCAGTSVFFIIYTLPLSHSNIDGGIILTWGIFLILLPFITPQTFLQGLKGDKK